MLHVAYAFAFHPLYGATSMSHVFAIAAQSVVMPDGSTINFRVNPVDSSHVEMHVSGRDRDGHPGTHVMTFKRNGGPQDVTFAATAAPDNPNPGRFPKRESESQKAELDARADLANHNIPLDPNPENPLADFQTVDEDAVRGDPRRMGDPNDARSAQRLGRASSTPITGTAGPGGIGNTKVDPVHGRINTVGSDADAGKPPEAKPSDMPESQRRELASVGLNAPKPVPADPAPKPAA